MAAARACRENDAPGRCIRRFDPAGVVGENTAWGPISSPCAAVRLWLASPGHRENLLGRWRATGTAVLPLASIDGFHQKVYVEVFAR
jgi:uncharacterized protein YkwD